ncbi:helix-turn-helix domain-containing protein [Roseibium porphyridii]|uniref:Helix-turn-helix domain-containing protein n=1 Tax=Roseibium porphyridii TaxID=2866279 RepID=A0ABY8F9Z6_9HYPH|nr:helix-turn-helix domain-containing protein [Roseibium sp. KMA01]WFE92276.1 helix-turn-helix domain-containing protein [Roseibium sp. KMA01]
MKTLGQRIKFAADKIGGLDALANAAGVKRATMYNYAKGSTEPKVSALVEIAKHTGVSVEWLAIGDGDVLRKTEVVVKDASLRDIRRYVWNIAETYWEQLPRRTKPDAFADKFLEMFDYLLTREDLKDDAVSEVIQFDAEQQKRASGQGET